MDDGLFEVPKATGHVGHLEFVPDSVATTLTQGCPSDKPFLNVPFTPQVGNNFFCPLALWMINMTLYAYYMYCHPKNPLIPPDLEDVKPLYWREGLSLFREKKQCGLIAKIKPLSNDSTNRILISFRGTDDIEEWMDNIDILQIHTLPKPFPYSLKVHHGFWNVFASKISKKMASLQDQIHSLLPQYLSKTEPNEIYIAGHSLGGAISSLTAYDTILRHPDAKIISYTIGSPRFAHRSLSTALHELSHNPKYHFTLWRIFNTEDVVPTVPPPAIKNFNFSHLIPTDAKELNLIGALSFSSSLGDITSNHHPITYFYGVKRQCLSLNIPEKEKKFTA